MIYFLGLLGGAIISVLAIAALRRLRIPRTEVSDTAPAVVVYAWGQNEAGQLGRGNTQPGTMPAPVSGPDGTGHLVDMTAIAAGYNHALALRRDGTVWAWGRNVEGQLGDGSNHNRLLPVQVRGPGGTGQLGGVASIAVGDSHSMAIDAQGRLWAWGYNGDGQLGDGGTGNQPLPVAVRGPGGVGQLDGVVAAAGGSGHSVALRSDGSLFSWGLNVSGQAGIGSTAITVQYPTQVHAVEGSIGLLAGVRAVAAGNSHTVASSRTVDPPVWGWGLNEQGAIGDGTLSRRNVPVAAGGLGNIGVTAVCAGMRHTIVLRGDRSVWAWGRNDSAQLGDGTTTTRLSAVAVAGPDAGVALPPIAGLSSTRDQALALAEDGSVWAWGATIGGVGDAGLFGTHQRPLRVLGDRGIGHLSGATAVASGGTFNLAIAPPPAAAQPDLAMRRWFRYEPGASDPPRDWLGEWIGQTTIDATGASQSVQMASDVASSGRVILRLRNAGQAADSFTIAGSGGNAQWTVWYRDSPAGGATIDPPALGAAFSVTALPDITAAVTTTGWTTPSMPAGASRDVLLVVQARSNAQPSGGYPQLALTVSAGSTTDPAARDAVRVSICWQWLG